LKNAFLFLASIARTHHLTYTMNNFHENLHYWNGLSDIEVSIIKQKHIVELMDNSQLSHYVKDRIYEHGGNSEIIELITNMNWYAWSLLVLYWKNTQGEDEIRQFLETHFRL
jgi:hypothetical protein